MSQKLGKLRWLSIVSTAAEKQESKNNESS